MTAINKTSITVFVVTVAVSILVALFQTPSQQKLHTDLYGREREQEQLLNIILGKPKIVELVGIAGVGKTVLILDTIDKLINEHGWCAVYVDVSKHNSTSSLLADVLNDRKCLSILNMLILSLTEYYYTVDHPLQSWYKALTLNTVLIFDSVDDMMDEMDETIIKHFTETKSRAKIVQISRFSKKEFLMRPVIQLGGMAPTACTKWITSKYNQINTENGNELCSELGGIPGGIVSIVEYLKSNISENIDNVVTELKNSHYGHAFAYLQSILEPNSGGIHHQIKAMHLLYDRLKHEHKLCLWLIVDMKGSYAFTKNMVEHHLQDENVSVDNCLDALLEHSFIETELDTHKQFKFCPYVRKFIQLHGEPEGETTRNSAVAKSFHGNYVYINAKNLHFELQNTQNLQLAIYIGSNQRLVNSFLPILGDKYDLKPLFKITLKVIKEHYCNPNGTLQYGSSAKALLAFSYLTKALYCPSIHPPSLLLPPRHKFTRKRSCLHMLSSCPAVEFIWRDDRYQSAEALGYHNSLLIYAHDSPPWQLSLMDISLIIIVAEHECAQYCKETNECYCGRKSNLERGLMELLLRNYQRSIGFFQTTLNKLSKNDQQCQTILKILAIIGIHINQYDSKASASLLLSDINLNDLNVSCYLGVLNDIIVPFLLEIYQIEPNLAYIFLAKRLNETVSEEAKRCNTKLDTDKEKLDCTPRIRYTVAHGLIALRMKELKDKLKWPQKLANSRSRERWICSIIRDKTTTCEKTLPLISQVRSIETNKNYKRLWVLKYFMNEEKYEQLKQKAQEIPRFYQKMSI